MAVYVIRPLILIRARYSDEIWSGFIQEYCETNPQQFFSKTGLIQIINRYAAQPKGLVEVDNCFQPGSVWSDEDISGRGELYFWVEIIRIKGTWQGRLTHRGVHLRFHSESEFFELMENTYAAKIKNAASLEQKRKTNGRSIL